ncbi:MAG: hypothetical protein GQ564_10075 [Bacteroidales bacterium]|nr:hypothetical protein [Bacteroidales bacterium]
MLKRTIFIAILSIVLFINPTQAQKSSVKLIASPRKDSVLLRWAPTNSSTWRLGNTYGYIVKRYTLLQGKKIPKVIPETILNQQPLKPAAIETWEKYADDKYVGIAAECIYGSVLEGVSVGGNPHIAYKKYKEEKHRFSFALYAADQSLHTAKLSGLYFTDKTALPKEKYLYKVYINCPDSLAVDTAFYFTGLSEYQPLPKPIELAAEWGDKEVNLSWNILYLKHIYNSYIVEKSTDGGKNFKRISENATVQVADKGINPHYMYKIDTLLDNKSTAYYRIKGISTFGEVGPASDSIFGKGTLPLKNAPVIVTNEVINNNFVKLYWDYPEKMNDYITGFNIYRSKKPSGKKTLIYNGKEPKSREYKDSTPSFTNYYLISVYSDKTEKLSPLRTYCERVDSFPPAPPQYFSGKIDTTGKVTLSWKANTDEDIYGYRVYRANNPRFEFMLISSAEILDTTFADSINLKTLTKKIHYKVRAIDERQNQSGFSEMLSITRPDIIPPVSPVIKNIADVKTKPEITWVNSSSSDVVYHHIFRKSETDSLTVVLESLGKGENITSTYLDKTVKPGKEYTYYIIAEDDSKLQSPASNIGYFKVKSEITEGIKLKKRVQTDRVKLTWSVKTDKQIERILVYRSVGEEATRLYGNSKEDSFTDKKLSPEKTYKYTIKAVYTDGSTSIMSNTVIVKM